MTSELGAEARALIDQACNEEALPPSAELERIRKNVVSGVAASAALLAAPHAAGFASGTTPLALLGLALKGGAVGTAVVLTAFSVNRFVVSPAPAREAAGLQEGRSASASMQSARPTVAPGARVAADTPPAPLTNAQPPLQSPALAGTATNRAAASNVASDAVLGSLAGSADLHEETVLLRRVQQELRAGRGAEALRLLDATSPRLERGQLRQERLAAEVLAACQTGDIERARRSAQAFVSENPATPSAARLRSSCVGPEFFEK